MNYYISDLHLGCSYIAERSHREHQDNMKAMNQDIIEKINGVVTSKDTLFILGDVSCYDYKPVKDLIAMKCKKILIIGNHDKRWLHHRSFTDCFEDIYDNLIVKEEDKKIFLSHYPMAEWDGYFKGIYQFYGHIHNSDIGAAQLMKLFKTACNVSYDILGKPMTAKEIIESRERNYNISDISLESIINALTIEKGEQNGTLL